MARAGINKVQVQKARDTVLARGENPSLDAIRIELGNTGSKSTIHRYLKELEEAESTRLDDEQLLSETLREMVARLAARLREEAGDLISEVENRHDERAAQWKHERGGIEAELEESRERSENLEQLLEESKSSLLESTEGFQSERVRSERLTQQVGDLEVRLADRDTHLKSLEDKHQHARDALEHYRQASKEQRDQDIRRHEQQVQQLQAELRQVNQSISVKQGEATQLNRDNARLGSELGAVRKQLGEREDSLRKSEQQLGDREGLLRFSEQQLTSLREELSQSNARLSTKCNEGELLQEQLEGTRAELKDSARRYTELQIELAEARTSLVHFRELAKEKGNAVGNEAAQTARKPE